MTENDIPEQESTEPRPYVGSIIMYGRVINIRMPNQNEGPGYMVTLDLHDKITHRGHLFLPYDPKRMNLGQVYEIQMLMTSIPTPQIPKMDEEHRKPADTGIGVI